MVTSGGTYRLVSDQIGSVRLVVDTATGAVAQRLDYDEFGRVTLDTAPGFQPFGFAGGLYDPDTGVIRVDPNRCDGCTWCIEACDFGAISINPATKLAEICNECEDEEDGPQCVKWCAK